MPCAALAAQLEVTGRAPGVAARRPGCTHVFTAPWQRQMTMAPDSGPPSHDGGLSPTTLETARRAIVRAVAEREGRTSAAAPPPVRARDGEAPLREALRLVAREARERGIPPERLVVTLKRLWLAASKADGGRDAPRLEQERRLRDFVALCVEEYFREE